MVLLNNIQKWWDKLDTDHKAMIGILSITILPVAVLYSYLAISEYYNKKEDKHV